MKKLLTLFCIVLSIGLTKAQMPENTNKEYITTVVDSISGDTSYVTEQMPMYPGGENELLHHLGRNIKYPKDARDCNCQGTTFISFIVRHTGYVSDIKVVKTHVVCSDVKRKHQAKCSTCSDQMENEAIRVIKTFPQWAPGKQNGKPVDVKYNLPVKFSLR
jgi:protein TonB